MRRSAEYFWTQIFVFEFARSAASTALAGFLPTLSAFSSFWKTALKFASDDAEDPTRRP